MQQICRITGKPFEITDDDLRFYEKMGVPPPTLCPEERRRRRSAFKNVERLYHGKSRFSGKAIISPYSPEKDLNVVLHKEWISDLIDAKNYGKSFDFHQSFFKQFNDLQKVAPRWDRITHQAENSEWSLNTAFAKNTYLLRGCESVENGFYSQEIYQSRDFCDAEHSISLELCYEIINGENLYDVRFAQDTKDVRSSAYIFDVRGSSFCLCCSGIRNKSYCILNKSVSSGEFIAVWKRFFSDKDFHRHLINQFVKLKMKTPRRFGNFIQCEDCSGNELSYSKNAHFCYSLKNAEDIKFCESGANTKTSYDSYGPDQQELTYETSSDYQLYDCRFVFNSLTLSHCEYCETCSQLKDCFACVGLKNAQYCILNKQYSKEEYFALREKIIEHMKRTGEWGEFFPIELSPFAYNETVAQEYFPLTKQEAIQKGYRWKDDQPGAKYDGPKVKIPEAIAETPDDICNSILECETCAKNYRIVKPELAFYRKMDLPVPHNCPDCRHKARMALRNPRKLWKRNCDNCGVDIETTFAPERPEKVFCEKCYLESVQ